MRFHFMLAVLTGLAFVLGGCAVAPPPLQPVALQATALRADAGRVGVAMGAVPRADTFFPGGGVAAFVADQPCPRAVAA
jgi:hypothetical protein